MSEEKRDISDERTRGDYYGRIKLVTCLYSVSQTNSNKIRFKVQNEYTTTHAYSLRTLRNSCSVITAIWCFSFFLFFRTTQN